MLDVTKFKITTVTKKDDYGKFEISPLPKGYGHSLGVPLRRVLLSSLEGAAITEVKIDGVKHEFTTITGVKEDALKIIFNLKRVVFQQLTSSKKPHILTLSAKGQKVITAGDIKTDGEVEVVNPEVVVAELTTSTAKLEMEITVESGLGYRLADNEKRTKIGLIPVDANFSPIDRVRYDVLNTRVGQETDLDKLIIEIWTRTANSAEGCINKAANILLSAYSSLVEQTQQEELEEEPAKVKKVTKKSNAKRK